MNLISTTFRFLSIFIIMCHGIINGKNNPPKLSPGQRLYACKFSLTSAVLASKWNKNEPAQRAVIKTGGLAVDILIANKTINLSTGGFIIVAFISNYVAEKYYGCARYYGFSIDALAEKCDILPDGQIRNVVNPITRVVVDTITDNQAMLILTDITLSMLSKK